MLKSILLLSIFCVLISCTKKTSQEDIKEIVYNYKHYTFIGQTIANYSSLEAGITTNWDTTYADSIHVQIDSLNDKIIFTANENNPLNVYPQFSYDFLISSNYFRKNFIKNYYQSFYFEGDTLKSYFFRLQEGIGSYNQKEIKFAGYLKN
ncbi:MAG: hypothetical protein ACOYLG_10865 [Chitinophagaceae bacterium]|jgi:hypothetical protein